MSFKLSSPLRTVFLGMMFIIPFFFAPSAHADVLLPGNISSCGELAVAGTYTLTSDIGTTTSPCLFISSDSVIVEGAGHTITGDVTSATGTNAVFDGNGHLVTGPTNGISITLHNVNVVGSINSGAGGSGGSSLELLVVGGGGAGGGVIGGGGGAGGVIHNLGVRTLTVGTFPVVVGNGAPRTTNDDFGANGEDSTFLGLRAFGGGGGGFNANNGNNGGSGGGAGVFGGAGSNETASQGNNGGASMYYGNDNTGAGGGGGGAGAIGGDADSNGIGGAGGNGFLFYGNYYGGGGGGYSNHQLLTQSLGGLGGGGVGGIGDNVNTSPLNAGDGVANTGGGGGGAWTSSYKYAGAGGSGIVILRYPTGAITATGGIVTTSGSTTIHTFTSSGNLTVSSVNVSFAVGGIVTLTGTNVDLSHTVVNLGNGNGAVSGSLVVTDSGHTIVGASTSVNNASDVSLDGTDYGSISGNLFLPGVSITSASDCSALTTAGTYYISTNITGDCTISPGITLDGQGLYTIDFKDSSYNEGTFLGDVIFDDSSKNFGTITGNATFNDSSTNSSNFDVNTFTYYTGTVSGNATFTLSNYDSNNIYAANPNQGTVSGNTIFSSLTPVTFTLRSGDEWSADTTNWVFATPGQSWVFYDSSFKDNGGIIVGNVALHNDSGLWSGGGVVGDVTAYNDSYPWANITGNLTLNDTSIYAGAFFGDTVNGNITLTASSFDSNTFNLSNGTFKSFDPIYGDVPSGTVTFTSTSPVTFTLRNNDIWTTDTTHWIFNTPGQKWILDNNSSVGNAPRVDTSWNQVTGSYTNSNTTPIVETFNFTSGWGYSGSDSDDLYQPISGFIPGDQYTVSMYVKLGTATNFSVAVNNQQAWDTIGGHVFDSNDLSTSTYQKISYTWTQPDGITGINLHLGRNHQSTLSGTPQTAGTVYVYGIKIKDISSSSVLSGDVTFNDLSSNNGSISGNTSFYGSSENDSTINGVCKLYENSTNNGTCTSVEYHKPFYFNNAAGTTTWDTLNNWWYDPTLTTPAPSVPTTGDIVYLDATTSAPLTSTILSQVYVASSTSGAFSVDLTNLTGTSTVTSIWNDGIIKGIINGILNLFSNKSLSSVDQASSPNGLSVNFYNSSYNDTNVTGNANFYNTSYNSKTGTVGGVVTFNSSSYNLGTLNSATFNNFSVNQGTTTSSIFNDFSFNASSTTNATFNDYSSNQGLVFVSSTFNNHSYNAGTTTNATFNNSSKNLRVSTLNTNLAAYWNLGETTSGTAPGGTDFLDISGNGNNGVAYGDVTYGYPSPAGNNAVGLGQTVGNAYIQIPDSDSLDPSSEVSFSLWFKALNQSQCDNSVLIEKGDGFYVGGVSYGLSFYQGNLNAESSQANGIGAYVPSACDGNWHNAVVVYSGNVQTIYLDGNNIASGTTDTFASYAKPLFIGSRDGGTNFQGEIADVGIWGRTLTDTEIAQLYNNGFGVSAPFLPSQVGVVTNNATFVGDLAENVGNGISGIVQGLKIRLYNALNPQTNFFRNFVTDGPWKIVADNTFVNLLNDIVDYSGTSTTATQFQNLNNGFILKKLSPGIISSCGILNTPGTYTLNADVTGYRYSPCFLVTTDGVTIDGATHTISALATSSSPFAVTATSTTDAGDGHSVTIENITFTNFNSGVNANGNNNGGFGARNGVGGNGGAVTILNAHIGSILSNGGNGSGNVGGNGGTIYVDPSVTGAITANGGDALNAGSNGGNGGAVTILNSRGTSITANGGNSLSCGNGGDSGVVNLTKSLYPTVFANVGSGANSGCPSTPHTSGGSHQVVVVGTYTDPDAPQVSSPVEVTTPVVSHASQPVFSSLFNSLSIPVHQIGALTLPSLPIFGSDAKGSFSFISSLQNFLFTPQTGGSLDSVKKTAPSLNTFLADIGVATDQAIASLNIRPYKLTNTNVQGLFTVKGLGTRLTGDENINLYQKVTAYPSASLAISLIPIDNKLITATFNGQTYTFNKDNTLTLVVPSKPGTYFLKTTSSPLPLAIVISSPQTPSFIPQTNIQPPSFISKVLGWFGL